MSCSKQGARLEVLGGASALAAHEPGRGPCPLPADDSSCGHLPHPRVSSGGRSAWAATLSPTAAILGCALGPKHRVLIEPRAEKPPCRAERVVLGAVVCVAR